MSKKPLLIVGILILVIFIGVLFLKEDAGQQTLNSTTNSRQNAIYPSREPANKPQTKLRFIPAHIQKSTDGTVHAAVFLDAFENQVTSVHLVIGYDPKVFKVLSVHASDILGGKPIDKNTIDPVKGTITYGAHVDLTQNAPLMGSDEIVEMTFQPLTTTEKTSVLSFLPGTTITAQNITGTAVISMTNTSVDLLHTTTNDQEEKEAQGE